METVTKEDVAHGQFFCNLHFYNEYFYFPHAVRFMAFLLAPKLQNVLHSW